MSNNTYPTGYRVPRHNVLLVTCMDLRLLDDILRFMDRDNLTNRYDQYILAGTSLGALIEGPMLDLFTEEAMEYAHWKQGLLDHLHLSIQLHDIHDIYLIEHRNCGAYKHFLRDGFGDFDVPGAYEKEKEFHGDVASTLTGILMEEIDKKYGSEKHINIHSFLMDLRGNVELLLTTAPASPEEVV